VEHYPTKKPKHLLDHFSMTNHQSKDESPVSLMLTQTLLERITSPGNHPTRRSESSKAICLGMTENLQPVDPQIPAVPEILVKFAHDYTTVKHWIIVAHSAPSGFPPVEWENIIKGKPVSLDNILTRRLLHGADSAGPESP
jgi:hypothetical protein